MIVTVWAAFGLSFAYLLISAVSKAKVEIISLHTKWWGEDVIHRHRSRGYRRRLGNNSFEITTHIIDDLMVRLAVRDGKL